MTLVLSDTGRQSAGTQKIIILQPPPVRETFLSSSPLILPTTPPTSGNGQVQFTLLSTDIQQMSPIPSYYQLCPIVHIGGKIGATASTITTSAYINGSGSASISSTSSSITSGNNWTASIVSSSWFNSPVKIGDNIEIRISASQSDVQLDYYAITCYLARCSWGKNNQVIKDLIYDTTNTSAHVCLLGRSPDGINNPPSLSMGVSTGQLQLPNSGITTLPFACMSQPPSPSSTSSFGLLAPYFGDIGLRNNINYQSHATYHPYYQRNSYPTKISYKEVLR